MKKVIVLNLVLVLVVPALVIAETRVVSSQYPTIQTGIDAAIDEKIKALEIVDNAMVKENEPNIIFAENFDAYPAGANLSGGGYGGWIGRWGGGIVVSAEQSVSVPQSAKMDNNRGCWESQLYHPLPYKSVIWFSADIFAKPTTRSGCHQWDVLLRLFNPDSGSWGSHTVGIGITRKCELGDIGPVPDVGLIVYTSRYETSHGYGWYDVANVESNYASLVGRWIHVMVKTDMVLNLVDVWIDGVHKATLEMDPLCPAHKGISLDCSNGIGYVDNIEVFTVPLNDSPVACIVGGNQLIEAQGPFGAKVTLDGSCSSDEDSTPGTNDDINDFDWYEIDPCNPDNDIYLGSGEIIDCNLPLGEHTIILEVIDKAGSIDSNEITVTIEDTTPPEIELSVTPNILWSPNGKMVEITPACAASDICDPEPEVSLVDITMNEPGNPDDIRIDSDGSIHLCAARSGNSKGRIYCLTYQACDNSGNCTTRSTTVTVPHDNRK